jgi:predicted transcriptional regulator
MATVSVKLADATKQQLDRLAATQGISPHALMVKAIERMLDFEEAQQSLLARASASRQQVNQGGLVLDGPAFADYLRAQVRGVAAIRPEGRPLAEFSTESP